MSRKTTGFEPVTSTMQFLYTVKARKYKEKLFFNFVRIREQRIFTNRPLEGEKVALLDRDSCGKGENRMKQQHVFERRIVWIQALLLLLGSLASAVPQDRLKTYPRYDQILKFDKDKNMGIYKY